MSYRFNTGKIVEVDLPGDPNHQREGPIVRQNDDDGFAEIQFEDHRQVYHDSHLNPVNQRSMNKEDIGRLPNVPLVNPMDGYRDE